MDSNTSLPPPEQYRSLVKRLQSSNYLLNKQLQHICLVNGLRTSGVKAELQRRILDGKLPPPLPVRSRSPKNQVFAIPGWVSPTNLGIASFRNEATQRDG